MCEREFPFGAASPLVGDAPTRDRANAAGPGCTHPEGGSQPESRTFPTKA